MMKFAFTLFMTTFVLGARAQYTLTAASNPVPGDRYHYYYMDTTGVTFGGIGTSQMWNYANLSVYFPTRITETYTTVASTPSASAFSAANIASETGSGYFQYYNISATERSLVGWLYTSGGGRMLVNTNPVPFCILPFSYGNSAVSNAFTSTYISSLGPNANYAGVMTITAEGTGTLILPDGIAHPNVLKMKTVKIDTLIGSNSVSTVVDCRWYSADSKFPLLDISVTVLSDGASAPFVNKTVLMNDIPDVGLREAADAKVAFSLYPNPSQRDLFIDFEAASGTSCSVDIVDMRGEIAKQEVFKTAQEGMQHKHVDLSVLSAGTYLVRLRTESKEGMRHLMIE